VRYFVAALVVFLLAGLTMPFVASASPSTLHLSPIGGHGCAQPVPPGIPGSPGPAPAASGIIVINEVLLTPHSTWNCSEHGTYFLTTDSWIELYNTQNQPFNLYASHAAIADNTNTSAFTFPFGASIAAHGYLVLFPYTDAFFKETSTPTLKLLISNVIVDQVAVPLLGPDQSYARTSDGASTWLTTSLPTIDASNTSLVTPTPTTVPVGNGGSGGGGSWSTPTASPTKFVNGKQPQWSKMQLPTASSVPTASTTSLLQSPSTTPSPANNSGMDTPKRVLLTFLVVAFAITLFWCWWLFRSP